VTSFAVRTFRGSAAEFHARILDDEVAPEVWVFEVDHPALVIGSAQRVEEVVDVAACEATGVAVVRRRSGGGVVLLEPGQIVWFDVVVPSAHLRAAGVDGVEVHRGGMVCSRWCPLLCFAGIGPGEVLRDGVKLVGISQRRSRPGSRFQCAVHTTWNPGGVVQLLAADVPPAELPTVGELPADVAGALPAAVALSIG
jgi:lipoate-protein ligase A